MEIAAQKIITHTRTGVDEIIRLLNQAFSDEWIAYYRYWTGVRVVGGAMGSVLRAELEKCANEELAHVYQLARRIIELDGTPIVASQESFRRCVCSHKQAQSRDVIRMLEQNLRQERCAIEMYDQLFKYVCNKDFITAHIVRQILQEEIEHEQKLEDFINDYKVIFSKKTSCKYKKK